MKKKGFIVGEYLAWWLLALGVLVLFIVIYGVATGKVQPAIEFLKNLFRYGG